MTDLTRLFAPFPPESVSWRVGSTNQAKDKGMALAFIDARDVMERLDDVFGPGGWQCDYPHANGKTVCRIGIKIGDEWVWKADGAGDTDVEAEKGALSDAFKRAAVRWGIGRYLYALPSPWVEIEPLGRSYRIKASEKGKLDAIARHAEAYQPAAESPAADFAIATMRTCANAEEFKDFWAKNKDSLKEQLTRAEYERVVAAMQDEAERFAPPKNTTPEQLKDAA